MAYRINEDEVEGVFEKSDAFEYLVNKGLATQDEMNFMESFSTFKEEYTLLNISPFGNLGPVLHGGNFNNLRVFGTSLPTNAPGSINIAHGGRIGVSLSSRSGTGNLNFGFMRGMFDFTHLGAAPQANQDNTGIIAIGGNVGLGFTSTGSHTISGSWWGNSPR